ncbi:spore germination protein [Paenibacillus protaetiae]|uniref:Spore gernimation protein GerA n=1 Tax=Paenibacillus protaetiae TaxID=2509456 RepID=A0A4P6ESA3_9BACL|nr:spore germination protein [Paenibacillus protaetiae]QAY65802.1 spore gernimation protein GerA [Paenibacillus protaetiae]
MIETSNKSQRQHIVEQLGHALDFHIQPLQLCGIQLELIALSSLVDIAATAQRMSETAAGGLVDLWPELLLKLGAEQAHGNLVQGLLKGRTLIVKTDGTGAAWVTSEKQKLQRPVGTPNNQNILISSQTGFIEDLATNLGLLRNELRSAGLQQTCVDIGLDEKRRIVVLSMANAADPEFAAPIVKALTQHAHLPFTSLQQLTRWLCKRPIWNPIPPYVKTESPHEIAFFLKKGRVVLMIEGYPEAIVLPVELPDLFISDTDREQPPSIAFMIIVFRILGVLVAITAPAAYVALVSVNPDVMKVELIYSIALSRVGVPYPSLTEALLLLFIIEMLFEALIRLPKSIGPAMTMVGGIILGQAVVSANLVSNLLIIILAASTIANFTIIGYHFALVIRLWRYIMLFLAALFGPLGIVCGFYLLLSLISSASLMRKPMVPLTPDMRKE